MLVMHTITPTTVPATIPPTPEEETLLPAFLPLVLLTSGGMDGTAAGLLGIMSLVDLMPEVIILVDIMLIAVIVVTPVDVKVVDVAATSIDIVLINFTLVRVLIGDVISGLLDAISLGVILTDITSLVITDCDDVVDDDIVVDIRETPVRQN